jgi:hypothetical protein
MSWLDGLRARLIDRFSPGRRDRELDEELRFHLDMETAIQIERGHDAAWHGQSARCGRIPRSPGSRSRLSPWESP